jgi:hypothetical protein
LPNDLFLIAQQLSSYRRSLEGIVVESTYNWYWLVDGLIRVHLAYTAAIQQYNGLKYTDDHSDARWLAHLLRLGVLPEGYIDPKEERGVRDLLRKRGQLVHQRTANLLSIQSTKGKIITVLSRMHRSKEGLAYARTRRDFPALVSAGEAYFGSWRPCMLRGSTRICILCTTHGANGE